MNACGCGAALGPKNKSGRCRSCTARHNNANPATIAARRAAIIRHHANPKVKAASAVRLASYFANMPEEAREKRREHGRRMYREVLSRPDVRAKNRAADVRKRAGEKRTATVLADIPEHLRDEYKALVRTNNVKAAEARRMVIEADALAESKRLAGMTQHERNMERVRNGAALITMPIMRKADHAFTLGGVASGEFA